MLHLSQYFTFFSSSEHPSLPSFIAVETKKWADVHSFGLGKMYLITWICPCKWGLYGFPSPAEADISSCHRALPSWASFSSGEWWAQGMRILFGGYSLLQSHCEFAIKVCARELQSWLPFLRLCMWREVLHALPPPFLPVNTFGSASGSFFCLALKIVTLLEDDNISVHLSCCLLTLNQSSSGTGAFLIQSRVFGQ